MAISISNTDNSVVNTNSFTISGIVTVDTKRGPFALTSGVLLEAIALDGNENVFIGQGSPKAPNPTDGSFSFLFANMPGGFYDVIISIKTGGQGAANVHIGVGPNVTGLTPATGAVAGGTSVTIGGTGFTGATSVNFGMASVVPSTVTDISITCVSPPGAAGNVNVTVVTPVGTSPTSAVFSYTGGGGPILSDMFGLTAGPSQLSAHTMNTGQTWTLAINPGGSGTTSDPVISSSGSLVDTAAVSTILCWANAATQTGTLTILWTTPSSGQGEIGLVGRFTDTNNYYQFTYISGNNQFVILKKVATSVTVLYAGNPGGSGAIPANTQLTLTFAFNGSTLTATVAGAGVPGGTQSQPVSDSALGGTSFGLEIINVTAAGILSGTINQFTFG